MNSNSITPFAPSFVPLNSQDESQESIPTTELSAIEAANSENATEEELSLVRKEQSSQKNVMVEVFDRVADVIQHHLDIPEFDAKQYEARKRVKQQLAPSYLKDLNWPSSLDELKLEEALQYELTSFFERIQQAVILPSEAHQLFIQVLNRFYVRPFHKKNAVTLEQFVTKLNQFLQRSACPNLLTEREDLNNSIRALKFFYQAEEISRVKVSEIRQSTSSREVKMIEDFNSKELVSWDIAKYSWEKFGCFIKSLLAVMQSEIQNVDTTLNAKGRLAHKRYLEGMSRNRHSALAKTSGDAFNELEKICQKVCIIEMIIASRGKIWMQNYQTILNAFQIQQPGLKKVVAYQLRQLRSNIQLLKNQIQSFEKMVDKAHYRFGLLIPSLEVDLIKKEVENNKNYFIADKEDNEDHKQSKAHLFHTHKELGKQIFKTLFAFEEEEKKENINLLPSLEDSEMSIVPASNAISKSNKKTHFNQEMTSLWGDFFTQQMELTSKVQELQNALQNLHNSEEEQRRDLLSEIDKYIKKARMPQHVGQEFKNFLKEIYRLLFSVHSDLNFCLSSLETFLEHLETFEKRFDSLDLLEVQKEEIEDQWFALQDQQDQQTLVKCMQKRPLLVKDEQDAVSSKKEVEKEEKGVLERAHLNLAENEIGENVEKNQTIMAKSSVMATHTAPFLNQFFHLPFVDSSCTRLYTFSTLSSTQTRIIRSAYQDVHLHLTILGSVVDLIQAARQEKDGLKFLPCFARMVARSLSTLVEQDMTAELLAYHYPYATLEHSHIELAKILAQESQQKFQEKELHFFKEMDYGVVQHRYPHSIHSSQLKNPSLIQEWLIQRQSIDFNQIRTMIEQTLHFLNRHQTLEASALTRIEESLQQAFSSAEIKRQKDHCEDSEKIKLLIGEIEQLAKKIDSSKYLNLNNANHKRTEHQEILLNIQYHLQGLKESLEGLMAFPNTTYLLAFGDCLFMHLQHLDELFEAFIYLKNHHERLHIHDLEMYRELRGHRENEQQAKVVAALNCGYGDHYPHRYQVMSLLHPEPKNHLPISVRWRLDALDISLQGEHWDTGFVPFLPKKRGQAFHSAKELRSYLVQTSGQMLELLISRVNLMK